MTDDDIIRAWEKCLNPNKECYGDDPHCHYSRYEYVHIDNGGFCFEKLRQDVNGVLKRQKAEIERLRKPGRWIAMEKDFTTISGIPVRGVVEYRCSECGRTELEQEPFCHCGAKMKGENYDRSIKE